MSANDSRKARHSSATAEHYSPIDIVDASRRLMGAIDLDPASCARANRYVRATKFYSKRDNGLSPKRVWTGRLFINPPGQITDKETGKMIEPSLVKPFWARLMDGYLHGAVEQAIWVGFSLEQLQQLQVGGIGPTPLDFPICIPSRRLRYLLTDGTPSTSPPHASYVAFLPPSYAVSEAVDAFESIFSVFGKVRAEISPGLEKPIAPLKDPRQAEFRGLA